MIKQTMIAILFFCSACVAYAADMPVERAKALLDASPFARGVACVPDSGDGELALALARQSELLILAMDEVARLREQAATAGILGCGLYVQQGGIDRIPFADHYVDLLVLDRMTQANLAADEKAEILRVLTPIHQYRVLPMFNPAYGASVTSDGIHVDIMDWKHQTMQTRKLCGLMVDHLPDGREREMSRECIAIRTNQYPQRRQDMIRNTLRIIASTLAFGLLFTSMPAMALEGTGATKFTLTEAYDQPAQFRVTRDVVNKDVKPFSFTVGGGGNNLMCYSFEPVSWRCRWAAEQDSTGKVFSSKLDWYDTLGDGFLDGGWVRVYRIENAKLRMVYEGNIPDDGFVLRDWMPVLKGRLIEPGTQRYLQRWDPHNRPDVPYYFAVAAVDRSGNVSAKSQAVAIIPPEGFGKAARVQNAFVKAKKGKDNAEAKDTQAPLAPANIRFETRDGIAEITWDPVAAPDLAGYRIYFSYSDPAKHEGTFIRLADLKQEIKKTDMIIAGKEQIRFDRRDVSHRVFGNLGSPRHTGIGAQDETEEGVSWQYVRHTPRTPVEESGVSYLQAVLEAGKHLTIGTYNHSHTGQSFYAVLEPGKAYRVEVWLKYEGAAAGKATFRLSGLYKNDVEPFVFTPGGEWTKHEATFIIDNLATKGFTSEMKLTLEGPGAYSVDNFRVYRADTAFLDYPPRRYDQLKRSGMRFLRTHGLIKTGQETYSMDQLTNTGGVITRSRNGKNTLPQLLSIMRKGGVQPWLQIEYHMSPDEWLAFVEYMAAPYDPATDSPQTKPYAAKRHAQGQTRPWVEEFDTIVFELSNETWNRMFKPWTWPTMIDQATGEQYMGSGANWGQVYGMFQEYVIGVMRSSPYWTPKLEEQFVFHIGGQTKWTYGYNAAKHAPSTELITHAAYNGGWDEGEGPPQPNPPSYFNVLSQVYQSAIPVAGINQERMAEFNAGREVQARLGTYEAGPGYAMNGLNGAKVTKEEARGQEEVMKSMAAGTATLDSFLARAAHGYAVDNFFTFSEGQRWSSHAKWYRGGQAYPSWRLLEVFNNHGTGDMLTVETERVPSVDVPGFKRRKAVKDAPLAAAYATRKDDRFTLFVLSRKIPDYPKKGDDGFIPVTVDLPFASAGTITLHRLTGDHTAHNFDSKEVDIETVEIPASAFQQSFKVNAATGADDRGLPPASSFIYVFTDIKEQ